MTRHTLSAFSMATGWASASCTSHIRSRKGVGSAFLISPRYAACIAIVSIATLLHRHGLPVFPGCQTERKEECHARDISPVVEQAGLEPATQIPLAN